MSKFGFSTIACPTYTIDQVIELAKNSGLEGVEIRHLQSTVDLATLPDLAPAALSATKRKFTDAGLTVIGVDTSVRMFSLDPAERVSQLENARANITIAEALGGHFIRVFGGPIPADQDHDQTLDAIAEGLSQIADESKEHGVNTIVELHDDFSTSTALKELWDRGASDHLGVLWDVHHTHRHGESPQFTWDAVGPRVKHVHIKDSVPADNPHGVQYVLTGEGDVPLPDFVELLNKVGYDGWISFEWEKAWHDELVEAEIAVPGFVRYLDGLNSR